MKRNTEERATEYMGKMISEQLQVGEDYQNLKKEHSNIYNKL